MTTLETRFDTILPTLATKEDLKNLEVTIHREINACSWRMVTWMTSVLGLAFTGVFFIARYVPV